MIQDGHWWYDRSSRSMEYTAPGDYEPGTSPPSAISLGYRELLQLIPALEENGFLKPRLDERLRAEDLKITHRLLDLLQEKL